MTKLQACKLVLVNTVNGERFAGLNFRGFEEDHESFSVNILHELELTTFLTNEPQKYLRKILYGVKTVKV